MNIKDALAFNEVLLEPCYSEILPENAIIPLTKFSLHAEARESLLRGWIARRLLDL